MNEKGASSAIEGSTDRRRVIAGVIVPLALVVVLLAADFLEGPKTAYVGVLTSVPFIAAVFLSPRGVIGVGITAWLAAFAFGAFIASDGNVTAQVVRLGLIALAVAGAAVAAVYRRRLESQAVLLRSAQEVAALAYRDPLTSLANRRGGERWIEGAPEADRCVLVCDADGLKAINDSYGHDYGDVYITAIARRLRANVSSDDLVARWGGDEFVIIATAPLVAGVALANRLLVAVSADPIVESRMSVQASLSIGVSAWPAGAPFVDALRSADLAMYEAKKDGRGQVRSVAEGR